MDAVDTLGNPFGEKDRKKIGYCKTAPAIEGSGSLWIKGHCEAFFAEAILMFNGDCFVASLLAMTFFKVAHYPIEGAVTV
jgi:hypothetical protein